MQVDHHRREVRHDPLEQVASEELKLGVGKVRGVAHVEGGGAFRG